MIPFGGRHPFRDHRIHPLDCFGLGAEHIALERSSFRVSPTLVARHVTTDRALELHNRAVAAN
jgi:hypothetical protein